MADNTLRFAVTLDDTGAIKGFRNLKTAANEAGSSVGTSLGTKATAGVGRLEKGLKSAGGALGHAKGQIMGLAGSVGLLAGAGGLLGLAGAITGSITKTVEFGTEVSKLAKVTGLATETTSALASVFDHYGISAETALKVSGMAEKNLGALTMTSAKAAKFQKDYGLALVDSAGHAKDFNALLLDSADYFNNKSIPASTKAAAMAKIYGRSWQDLLPVLSAGRRGIQDAETAAKDFGVALTGDNVKALAAYKASMRDLGDAVTGLELGIGTMLLPEVADLAKSFTEFVAGHRSDIVGVFRGIRDAVKEMGGIVANTVIPAFQSVVGAFQSLPEPVKQLLIGGFVGNKVVKWTFGIDVAGLAGGALKGAIEGLFKNATTANMNVQAANVNVAGGGVGNLLGEAGGAAGAGGSVLAGGAVGAGLVTVAAAAALAVFYKLGSDNQAPGGANINVNSLSGQAQAGFANAWKAGSAPIVAALGDPYALTGADRGNMDTGASNSVSNIAGSLSNAITGALHELQHPLDKLHQDFLAQRHILEKNVDPATVAKAATRMAKLFASGIGGEGDGKRMLALLEKDRELVKGNPKLLAMIDAAIQRVRGALPRKEWIQKQLDRANQIAKSSETTKEKIRDLTAIQAAFTKRGDTHAAAIISAQIASLKTPLYGIWRAIPLLARSAKNTQGHAAGMIGMTTGVTDLGSLGIAGEIKGEAVAVIANPHPLAAQAAGSAPSRVDFHLHVHGANTPGAMREAAQAFGPSLVRWMQSNGVLPRTGSPMLG